jgi:hypothetical protein
MGHCNFLLHVFFPRITGSVADPDLFVRIRILTSGTGFGPGS